MTTTVYGIACTIRYAHLYTHEYAHVYYTVSVVTRSGVLVLVWALTILNHWCYWCYVLLRVGINPATVQVTPHACPSVQGVYTRCSGVLVMV